MGKRTLYFPNFRKDNEKIAPRGEGSLYTIHGNPCSIHAVGEPHEPKKLGMVP